jgi:hypothetical protein
VDIFVPHATRLSAEAIFAANKDKPESFEYEFKDYPGTSPSPCLSSQYHLLVTDLKTMQAPSMASQLAQTSHIPKSSKRMRKLWSRLSRGLKKPWSLRKARILRVDS